MAMAKSYPKRLPNIKEVMDNTPSGTLSFSK